VSGSSSGGDVGVLQPAVAWLAHKLVQLAAIKEEELHHHQQQQQQGAAGAAGGDAGRQAAPLSTYAALQAMLTDGADAVGSGADVDVPGQAGSLQQSHIPQQQQQQQQRAPEVDIVFIHGIRGGPFVSWRRGASRAGSTSSSSSTSSSAAGAASGGEAAPSSAAAAADAGGPAAGGGVLPGRSKGGKRQGVALSPSAVSVLHSRHMTQRDLWPAAWLAADVPNARLLSVEYKVRALRLGHVSLVRAARVAARC
jgi:hypothetical protein